MAVVDLETTGLPDDAGAELLEFGAVLLTPGDPEVGTVQTLLRPSAPVPPAITRLTGIRDGDVAAAPRLDEVAAELARAIAGRRLVAHNASFERSFLGRLGLMTSSSTSDLDTQDLLALTHPDAPDLRLESFTRMLLGAEERHRAFEDALDTARILGVIAKAACAGEQRYGVACEALARFSPESSWLYLLRASEAAQAAERAAEATPPRSSDQAEAAQAAERAAEAKPPRSSDQDENAQRVRRVARRFARETPIPFDADAIADALRDEERGRHFFPGYRAREEQVELARAVVRAIKDREVLLLEGGTGVGKSLAYLSALIPFVSSANAAGAKPALISTRTKLLQDQLLDKDIPAAAAFLGYPELRAMSIKGRGNYACERRLAAALAEGLEPSIFPGERFAYALLASGAAIRPHGELAALPGAWIRRYPALGDLLRRSVAARSDQCTREDCARHPNCALGKRRGALASAQLIVANHDLLLRWPADYPEFSIVVADEAHELTAVADEVYAQTVRPAELLERLDDLFGSAGASPQRVGDRGLLPAGKRRAFRRDATAWRRALQQDFVGLGRSLAPHASEFGEVQIPAHPGRDESEDWVDPDLEPGPFAQAAVVADAAAGRIDHVAQEVERELGGATEGAIQRNLDQLKSAADALRQAFAGDDDAVAAFEDVEHPYDRWSLAVRPLSPAAAFREALLDRLDTFVGVSASLLIEDSAFAALGELEIEESEAERLRRVSLPSPFPYAEHMKVVALRDRGDLVAMTAEAIERLAVPLGGRTLALFTSLRRMRDVAERLTPVFQPLGIEIIAPRRAADDPSALLERFRRGSAVLLGARKFWQGVDLPGDTLQAVVIEKLPFEVPTELRRRRELRLRRAGRDPFHDATLGKMLLNLKQMAGRLIRSEEDRGLVVIVESRSDRRYFRRLSEALPPGCPLETAELRDLEVFLKELGLP